MKKKEQSERELRRTYALQMIGEMKRALSGGAKRRGRPFSPHRCDVAWACVEFFRDRQGSLPVDSTRGAAVRLAMEMRKYFVKGKSPGWSHLRNLHIEATTKMTTDQQFRAECELILARLRSARHERGSGLTIPEYLDLPVPGASSRPLKLLAY
jgi:hypothetical protein